MLRMRRSERDWDRGAGGVIKIHYSISSRNAGALSALWRGSSIAMKLHSIDIAIIKFNWYDKLEKAT